MEIAGKDRRIMVDANQKFNVSEAILRGKVYQEMGATGWKSRSFLTITRLCPGLGSIGHEDRDGENDYTNMRSPI